MTKNEAMEEIQSLQKGITHDAAQLLQLLGTGSVQLPINGTDQYVVAGTLAMIAKVLPGAAVSQPAGDLTDEPFADWLKREMPAGTVINDPAWWVPRIERAAIAAYLASQSQAAQPSIKTWRERMEADPIGAQPAMYFADAEIADLRAALAGQSQATKAEVERLHAALRDVRRSLQLANDMPSGPIQDTLWMDHDGAPETVFDFIDAALYADPAGQATKVQAVPEGWTVERVGEAIHIKRADGRWTGFMPSISPAHGLTYEFLSATLANHTAQEVTQQAAKAETAEQAEGTLPVELMGIREEMANGSGFWQSCSGCHDTEDGHPTGPYSYSHVFGCALGSGCSECGGVGAVWDNTDYDAMYADDVAPTTSTVSAPDEIRNQAYAKCIEIAESELSNTNVLTSMPPQSSAAFSIINRILFLRTNPATPASTDTGSAE